MPKPLAITGFPVAALTSVISATDASRHAASVSGVPSMTAGRCRSGREEGTEHVEVHPVVGAGVTGDPRDERRAHDGVRDVDDLAAGVRRHNLSRRIARQPLGVGGAVGVRHRRPPAVEEHLGVTLVGQQPPHGAVGDATITPHGDEIEGAHRGGIGVGGGDVVVEAEGRQRGGGE